MGRGRRRRGHRHHPRRLCGFHVRRLRASPSSGGDLEQYLAPALFARGDQLHQQLDLRAVRGRRLMDRRLPLDDLPARRPESPAPAPG